MPIDWFTVAAQILNFIVLVWILKRFLYAPVLKTMAERQARIRATIEDADAEKKNARQQREAFEQKQKAVMQTRDEILQHAEDDAAESNAHSGCDSVLGLSLLARVRTHRGTRAVGAAMRAWAVRRGASAGLLPRSSCARSIASFLVLHQTGLPHPSASAMYRCQPLWPERWRIL
jgi:hypothetical protein